jgi:hypothetical protein
MGLGWVKSARLKHFNWNPTQKRLVKGQKEVVPGIEPGLPECSEDELPQNPM